ncbi:hypothetical protein B0J11DRAFT_527946 [Dendryphion nanum]|uniref:Uncharacterized protein n=1 Tax=Dendryphion nanum TaxID=256645 RepID=A0A9P9DU27_9PLEO|nr:hypothetical protein B0J11DRAFT_527946 [Dendryphion nanum]
MNQSNRATGSGILFPHKREARDERRETKESAERRKKHKIYRVWAEIMTAGDLRVGVFVFQNMDLFFWQGHGTGGLLVPMNPTIWTLMVFSALYFTKSSFLAIESENFA